VRWRDCFIESELQKLAETPAHDIMRALKTFFRAVISNDAEPRTVMRFVASCAPGATPLRILDVGCGTGRYLRACASLGFDVTGVDANREIVEANRGAGFRCMSPQDVAQSPEVFDVIIMSHVIEHHTPSSLLRFMDEYLDKLRSGGYLIIATPLLNPHFYTDFDHVKPYDPIGIDMVFGPRAAQVQYQAHNRIQLKDIWFRRSALRIGFARAQYVRTPWTRPVQAIDFVLALLFLATFRLIGRADGWVGIFEKVLPDAAAAS
jgi:SAM-dependent methyltransferase